MILFLNIKLSRVILIKSKMVDLTNEEQTAMMVFIRIPKFVEGYNLLHDLEDLVSDFKNIHELENIGLVKSYYNLKERVIKDRNIGLIIYGLTLSDSENKFLGIYTTFDNTKIHLSLTSICSYLRNEYFTKQEISELCRRTPNFNVYYNNFKYYN